MKYVFWIIALIFSLSAHATGVSSNLTYQGRIIKPNGTALEAASVTFTLQVRSPDVNNCVLYEEEHIVNMSNTGGIFSLTLGGGTRSAGDPGLNFKDIFSNALAFAGPLTCDSGSAYTPATGHQRKLHVTFNDGSGAIAVSPDMSIRSVPYAFYAEKLQGLGAADVLQVSGGNNLSQANLQSVFTGTNYGDLMDIINGTSTKYIDSSPTSSVGFNGQRLTNIADPTGAQDAATKNYCDMNMGGSAVDTNIGVDIGPAIGDGKVLTWDAAGNRWVAEDPVTGNDNLGNHTATMDLDMDGNKVINMADPTAAQDGATKNYVDTKFITKNLPAAPAAGQNGQALRWNNGGNAWEFYTPVSAGADNLGDHTATQNIELGPNFISRDGDNEGLSIDAGGNATFSGTLAMSTNRITGVGDPTGAQDASTKNYSDTKFITKNLPAVPAVGQNGQALRWNNGGNTWEYYTPSTGNVSDTRDMIAGSGLTGGGTLAADRTFNVGAGAGISVAADSVAVDINGATGEATPDNADSILIYDSSASALRKQTRAQFLSGIGGSDNLGDHTATADLDMDSHKITNVTDPTNPQDAATMAYVDAQVATAGDVSSTRDMIAGNGLTGGGTLAADRTFNVGAGAGISVAADSVAVDINGATGEATADNADSILIYDSSASALRKQTRAQFLSGIGDNLGNHTATGALNMSSNLINNLTDPSAAQDAATKNYVDTKLITKNLPAAPAVGQNGQALRWNNGGNAWEYYTPSTGDVASTRDMIAGSGLTGGGTLAADRTFNVGAGAGISVAADSVAVDINGATGEATPDNADSILIYDSSASALRKQTRAQFLSGIGGSDNLGNHTATANLNMSGNSILGGTASGNDLTLESTSDATKGDIYLQPNGGNVGIGTTSPIASLHLHNHSSGFTETVYTGGTSGTSSGDGFVFGFNNSNFESYFWNKENAPIYFGTNNLERMRILANGNVGIGTNNPGAKLEVAGQVKITGGTPGAGKVLTSDASGLATWESPGAGADHLGNHTATGALNMSSNLINNVTDPAAAQDAATKNYVDTKFITKTLPAAPAAGQNAQSLRWNNGGSAWEYYTPVSTGTTMSAGNGLTGGGDLSANRAFDVGAGAGIGVASDSVFVDIPSVTNMGEAVSATDTLLIYDASLTSMREIARSALVLSEAEVDAFVSNNGYGTGNVSSGITLTAGDGLTGGGDLSANRTFAVGAGAGISVAADSVAVDINGTAAETTADNADTILIYDNSTTSLKKMTRANFLSGIGGNDNLGNHTATTNLNMSGNSVLGGTAASADLTLESTSNGTKGDVLINPNGGNVGIGTASPGSPLSVTRNGGTTGTTLLNLASDDTWNSAIQLQNNSTGAHNYSLISTGQSNTNGVGSFFIYDNTSTAVRFAINSSGNVGIGTTTPAIQTSAGRAIATIRGSSDAGGLELATAAADADGNLVGTVQFSDGNSTNADKRAAFIRSKLSGTTANNRGGTLEFVTKADGGTVNERMRIDNAGNVGIGTITPGEKLEVNGKVKATNFIVSSDRKFKKDIVPVTDALARLSEVRGVNYTWRQEEFPEKEFSGELQYGVIAQEVAEVFPDLVYEADGSLAVNYQGFIAPLIEALKELNGKVDARMSVMSDEQAKALAAQVEINTRDIASLKAENAQLKQKMEEQQKQIDWLIEQVKKK